MRIVNRWAVEQDFNPLSPKQILEYLHYFNYPIPKNRKTKKPTTNEEGLLNLSSHFPDDPNLFEFVKIKKFSKYASYLNNANLGSDGRMHSEFTSLPRTGRLSSRNPNLQNIPQGKKNEVERKFAEAIRSTVIPSPGHLLVELDWKAIEALLVGFFAEDNEYIRICKIDPHSILASHILHSQYPNDKRFPVDMKMSDEEIIKYCKWIKKEHDPTRQVAKKNNHAGNYDQGARNRAKDIGCTVQEAKYYMSVMDVMSPKVRAWKINTRLQAHKEGKLTTPFGYTNYFYEVFTFKNEKTYLGKEAWQALAFLPQSSAAAMCKTVVRELFHHPLQGKEMHILVPIHDSLLLEIREESVKECVEIVRESMTRPWKELNGLVVDVDVKVGENWAKMEEMRL